MDTDDSKQEPIDDNILEMLRNIAEDSVKLEPIVKELNETFDSLYPPPHCAAQLSTLSSKYVQVIASLDSSIRQAQKALSILNGEYISISSTPSALTTAMHSQIPSRSSSVMPIRPTVPHKMVDLFLTQKLPIVGMPYPPLCAAIPANPDQKLSINSFVASCVNQEWTLCYIVSYSENGYMISDADSENSSPFYVTRDQVIPLPTTLPDRTTKSAEFATGTQVLSLWKDGGWTSVFYKATVVTPPSEAEPGENGYHLQFEDDSGKPLLVPQNFVILAPKN